MLKWVIKLSEYEIKYQPRLVLKGQVMIDFIAELPQKPTYPVESPKEQWWTLYVDQTSRVSGFGVDLILQSQTEELLEQVIRLNSSATNNEVEYEAILVGLDIAITIAATGLEIKSDSQLIVGQI